MSTTQDDMGREEVSQRVRVEADVMIDHIQMYRYQESLMKIS
jgi:hypothetical protein